MGPWEAAFLFLLLEAWRVLLPQVAAWPSLLCCDNCAQGHQLLCKEGRWVGWCPHWPTPEQTKVSSLRLPTAAAQAWGWGEGCSHTCPCVGKLAVTFSDLGLGTSGLGDHCDLGQTAVLTSLT